MLYLLFKPMLFYKLLFKLHSSVSKVIEVVI